MNQLLCKQEKRSVMWETSSEDWIIGFWSAEDLQDTNLFIRLD